MIQSIAYYYGPNPASGSWPILAFDWHRDSNMSCWPLVQSKGTFSFCIFCHFNSKFLSINNWGCQAAWLAEFYINAKSSFFSTLSSSSCPALSCHVPLPPAALPQCWGPRLCNRYPSGNSPNKPEVWTTSPEPINPDIPQILYLSLHF